MWHEAFESAITRHVTVTVPIVKSDAHTQNDLMPQGMELQGKVPHHLDKRIETLVAKFPVSRFVDTLPTN